MFTGSVAVSDVVDPVTAPFVNERETEPLLAHAVTALPDRVFVASSAPSSHTTQPPMLRGSNRKMLLDVPSISGIVGNLEENIRS